MSVRAGTSGESSFERRRPLSSPPVARLSHIIALNTSADTAKPLTVMSCISRRRHSSSSSSSSARYVASPFFLGPGSWTSGRPPPTTTTRFYPAWISPPSHRRQLHLSAAAFHAAPRPSPPSPPSPTSTELTPPPPPSPTKSLLSRIRSSIPSSLRPPSDTSTSIRKLLALARPEKKTIGWAVALLVFSSLISASVPFTIGSLIDFFSASSDSPVSPLSSSAELTAKDEVD